MWHWGLILYRIRNEYNGRGIDKGMAAGHAGGTKNVSGHPKILSFHAL